MRDQITLIWFTGVVSQYDVSNYDLANLKINHKLLDKILNTYKATRYIALVNVRNEYEKTQYLSLITKEHLEQKLMFVFVNMDEPIFNAIGSLLYSYNIVYYIDCSRRRLVSLTQVLEPRRLIHISQLLD